MDFFFATIFSLFSIVDPPGAVPVYVALTGDRPREERNKIALKTSLYFLLILVSFFLAGNYILSFFGLTLHALRIAGGIALLINGFALMSGNFAHSNGYDKKVEWVNTNLALSLLLQGKYTEAEKIYLPLKDKPYSDATYKKAFLADLDEMEKNGITHTDFEKIRALLK